jgi:hypothetical protein
MTFNRRKFVKAAGATAAASALGFPAIVRSQAGPIRIGLLTIKTGALASGGIDMERGLTIFLKEKNYMLGGRKVELSVADSGGVPAQARTKMQELVERERVQAVVRAAGGVRGAGDGRLHPYGADSDAAGGRRRRHDPAQGEPVVRPRHIHIRAVLVSDRRLRREKPEIQAYRRHRRRLRLRPRAAGRLPQGVRGCGRHAGAEVVLAAERARLRLLYRAAQDRYRRRVPRLRRRQRLPLLQASTTSTASRRRSWVG